MIRAFLVVVLVFVSVLAFSQPRIDKVERISAFPFATVQITGDGFSATAGDLRVWFGNVKGTIVTSSLTSITVTVPAQARLSAVEVINVITKRSARAPKKFIPNFSGKLPFVNSFLSKSFTNASDIFDLCACDLDGDGKTDMVGSNFKDGGTNLMLLINSSTITANNTNLNFTSTAITLANATISLTCGDLNGDGKPEIVATRGDRNGTNPGNSLFIFPNTSSGPGSVTFGTPVQLNTVAGDILREVAIHDLNRDGQPEIVATNGAINTMYIFENNLSTSTIVAGEFTRFDKVVTNNTAADLSPAGTLALDIADMNNDGWPDVVVTPNKSYANQKIFIFNNPTDGSFNFTLANTPTIGGNINDLALADFNNDGLMDIVIADRGGNKAFVHRNLGGLIFQSVNAGTGFASPSSWGVDVADMNGDGFVDFVTGNRDLTDAQVNIYLGNGAAIPVFIKNKIVAPKSNWFVKSGDFDGDSKPDIAMTSADNSGFGIYFLQNRNCHQPVILNANPLAICSPQTITLNAVPLQGVSYSWSTGGTGPSTNITVANAGTITLTAVGDGGTCSVQTTITVNAGGGGAPVKPTITNPAGVCAGSSLTLVTDAVGGSPTYLWSGPNGFTASTAVPTVIVTASASVIHAGDYSLRVQVVDCISETSDPKTVAVVAPESFTIVSNAGNAICVGQAVTLSVAATGYDFQWKKGGSNVGGNSSSFVIAAATETDQADYSVVLTHQTISCTSTTSPFTINVYTAPVASFIKTPVQVCVGTLVDFSGTASTVDSNAPAPTPNYVWDFGDASSGGGVTASHTYTVSAPITARLTVSYTGVTGCSNFITSNFTVNNATAPSITVTPLVTEICGDGSESIDLSVLGTFNTFTWSNAATSSSIAITLPGTYSVATTDANGCAGNAELVLTEKPGCEGGPQPAIDIKAPKVFTPNQDGINDSWVIVGIENYPDCELNMFDGRGRRIYSVKGSAFGAGWDGIANGKEIPAGTYFYVFGCPDSKTVTGTLLIVRKK